MAYPKQKEMEEALLKEIEAAGGSVRPKDIYAKVAAQFPQLTPAELQRRSTKHPQVNIWSNKVQWVRQRLVTEGLLDGSVRGVWTVTDAGRRFLQGVRPRLTPPERSLADLIDAHEKQVREKLLGLLRGLSPEQFEHFARRLLEAAGFTAVQVTGRSHDGGVDGHGKFKQGIVIVDAAFQCKRWQGSVPRPQIDRFRGAISGKFDQGIFITTSGFSKEASEASIRRGAVPIILIDGERVVDLMIQHQIGVSRKPLYLLDVDESYFEAAGMERSASH